MSIFIIFILYGVIPRPLYNYPHEFMAA